MPADDLVLNVRQIAQYAPQSSAPSTASLLMQLAGIGSAYGSISPAALVGTALAQGGNMAIGGALSALSFSGGSAQFSNAAVNLLEAVKAGFREADILWGTIGGQPIASTIDVDNARAATVWSFEGRRGDVSLWVGDIIRAGGAPIVSPRFFGTPMADTPCPGSNSTRLATTAFVQQAIPTALDSLLANHPFVFTFNGRTGDIVLTEEDILAAGGGGVFDSVALTGIPTAPTAPFATSTTQIATTQFVQQAIATSAIWAPVNSPNFIGLPTAPTPPPGTNDGQLATTAFVQAAVTESTTGVASWNGRTGAVTLEETDILAVGGAPLASPIFTGIPQAPTPAPGNNSQAVATTAYVMAALGTGGVTTFNGRSGAVTLVAADLTGAGGALLDSPQFTGLPTAPTATLGNSTTQIATTAFVMANLGVASFNNRTGAVSLIPNDISAAGGLINPSVALTGTPTAPTASPGTNSTQLATTAYVTAALAAAGGVQSFNGRAGVVTLSTADVTGAGGAPSASPGFTGVPSAPTASPGTTTTQLATTAFVMAALAVAGGVTSFNTRAGAVTLQLADITGAGGAPTVSPNITGGMTVVGVAGGYALSLTGAPAGSNTAGLTVSGGINCVNNLTMSAGSMIVPSSYGIRGITDGSTAQPGTVGEYITATNGPVNAGISVVTSIVQIALTPGDWDIMGFLSMSGGTSTLTAVQVGIGNTANAIGTLLSSFNGTITANSSYAVSVGPLRSNNTSNLSFFLSVGFYGTATNLPTTATIWARRRR